MSVVGFDIGNENCVIGTVKQRGIDVLLNDESKRETPSVVCFGEKQRFLGSAGAVSAMMHPKTTVSQVKRLIGRNFREPSVQNELKLLPFETSEGPDGGILIHLKYVGEAQVFTPVQILAMLFAHLKDIAEKNLEIPVSDCVIGVPSYFTDLQRRSYLDAAKIAGLNPLRLVHDCTATALSYGIYKTDISTKDPSYVAFVDIGHCDTQVSIVSFEVGKMKIVSHAFDGSLGGRDFDEVLVSHFASQFKEQYKIDVYSNAKACIRLRAACEKVKKVLSANAEAPLNIECLMDEKDVKGSIKREEFEKLASGLLERISVPCHKALVDSGLTAEKIVSVELVGSGSRIPAITRLVASVFQKDPKRTLNASECVARGCALQCAMLSPAFRVKEYEVQDSIPFSLGLSTDNISVCTMKNYTLFPKGQPIPSVKVLTFQRSNMFDLEVFYTDPNELPAGVSSKISCFTGSSRYLEAIWFGVVPECHKITRVYSSFFVVYSIGEGKSLSSEDRGVVSLLPWEEKGVPIKIGPLKPPHSEKAKVKVRVQINLNGIVTVESATLIEDHVDDSVARSGAHSSTDNMNAEFVPENDLEDDSSIHSESKHASTDGMKKHNGNRRLQLPVSENIYGGMTKPQLSKAQEKELQLAKQDRDMEETKEKKNALESYVYETRSKLFSMYRNFVSEQEKEGISRSLQQTEEWLYDEGDDETQNAYTSKLDGLKKLVDPIENRCKDEEARAQATRHLLKRIVDRRMSVGSLPPEDREVIINACNRAEEWLREKTQQQDSLPKNTDPILWSSDIRSRAEDLELTCKQILGSKASPPQ